MTRRRRRELRTIAIAAACVAVILVIATVIIVHATRPRDKRASTVLAADTVLLPEATATVEVTATPAPTQDPAFMPDATAEVQTTAEPTATPEPTVQAQTSSFEYLPVIHSANTTEKKIAITVDDCFQMDNLKHIALLAYNNGGKLTLFPIGENVVKSGMDYVLQVCAFKMGFEIENHTWSHARIFRLSEEEMAEEIWKQRNAVNQALGVNYEQHFFRFMGGDGEHDQRSHNYLKQLGYTAVADWSCSGSDSSMEAIKNHLQPGAVYLFHTTDADTAKLDEFIPYAVSQGYQLVTLNELFGLEDNAQSDLSTWSATMPEPQEYTVEYIEQKKGDYSWAVVRIQQKLYELGYLSANSDSALKGTPADGVYGDSTAKAIQKFQADNGLPVTGVADVETQKKLLG